MNKLSGKFLFLILALSVASMSAHGFVDQHESEICKVCLFKINERDELDTDNLEDGICSEEFTFSETNTPSLSLSDSLNLNSFHLTGPNRIRGPPAIS